MQKFFLGQKLNLKVQVIDQYGQVMQSTEKVQWNIQSGPGTISNKGLFESNEVGLSKVKVTVGSFSKEIQISIMDLGDIHLKVNAGGGKISDWESDEPYLVSGNEGQSYTFSTSASTNKVKEPAPQNVYKTVRHQEYQYSFPSIPNGSYKLRFHFNDGVGGDRRMEYKVEGKSLIKGLDVEKEAGGLNKVLIRELEVEVSDGNGLQNSSPKKWGQ